MMKATTKPVLIPLFSAETIAKRLDELADEINAVYAGEKLVVVCVLKGAFMFFSDLVGRLTCEPELDFVRLASYGNSMESTRSINFTKDVELSLEGKHVLIVEDIIDTGHSMDFLLRQFAARGTSSLRLVSLIDKQERRDLIVCADFVGFSVPGGFLVGYGIDYAEKYRELPALYTLVLGT